MAWLAHGVLCFLLIISLVSAFPKKSEHGEINCGQKVEGNNGSNTTWPWLAAIFRTSPAGLEFICEGSLINRMTVVTAAHCVFDLTYALQRTDIIIHLGRSNMGVWGETDTSTVMRATLTPNQKYVYDDWNFDLDIAILKLDREVEFTNTIRPVCLMEPDELESKAGDEGYVVGWRKKYLDQKLDINVKIGVLYPREECEEKHKHEDGRVLKRNFCVFYKGEKKSMNHEQSARPMYLLMNQTDGTSRWVLKGIMNTDINRKNAYLFTNVSDYRDWILKTEKWQVNYAIKPEDLAAEKKRNLTELMCQKEIPIQQAKFEDEIKKLTEEISEAKEHLTKTREEEEKMRDELKSALSNEQICILFYQIRGILINDKLTKEANSLLENVNDLPKETADVIIKTESYKKKGKNGFKEAIKSKDLTAVKCLVYEGGNINEKDLEGNNALHIAAKEEQLAIYIWLANRNNSDLTATNKKGETSIQIARKMCNNNKDSIEWMIKNVVPDMDGEGNTILHNAAQNATFETVKCILDHKMGKAITKNRDDYNSLHYAAIGGNSKIMKILSDDYGDSSVDIRNKEGETPLNLAAIGGHLECAKILVGKGADFLKISSYKGHTALQEAVHRANSVADFLIDEAPKRNLTIKYVDLSASENPNTDIDTQDLDGNTALHIAAQHGTAQIIEKLLNAKADLFIKNNDGKRPVDLAIDNKNYKFDEKYNTNITIHEWLSDMIVTAPLLYLVLGVMQHLLIFQGLISAKTSVLWL